jgi:hypothetical protein
MPKVRPWSREHLQVMSSTEEINRLRAQPVPAGWELNFIVEGVGVVLRVCGIELNFAGYEPMVPRAPAGYNPHVTALFRLSPNPNPYTLHPTPYTLHSAPCTLHLTPYTLHPTPYTSI